MPHPSFDPPFDQLRATAETVAQARPEVDRELALELFAEAADLLYNGLALDGLDGHDAQAVIAGLCLDLVSPDPGGAVRARAQSCLAEPATLHDPAGVSASYLFSATVLQL